MTVRCCPRGRWPGHEISGLISLPARAAAEPPSDPSRDEVVYLKKWVKTKQAVLFILSTLHRGEGDGLIQVNFAEDNARVLLHNGGTQVLSLSLLFGHSRCFCSDSLSLPPSRLLS